MAPIERDLLPRRANEFLDYLYNVKNSAPLTIAEYARDLRLFFSFYAVSKKLLTPDDVENKAPMDFVDDALLSGIRVGDIYDFMTYCGSERGNSITTRRRKSSALRGFFKYISDNMGYIDNNPTSNLQLGSDRKKLPKYLTLEQSQALLQAVTGENAVRDRCILTLFLNCGLRLAELCALNLSSIDLDRRTMLVLGKGSKERMLYLNDACVSALTAYLKVRPVDALRGSDRNALFISRLNKRIGRQAVQLMVYHYLNVIGLQGQNYSVHKLRHTAATLLYQYADVDVLLLKDMLGHENLSTTQIYTHVDNEQLRQAIDKNPLNTDAAETPPKKT